MTDAAEVVVIGAGIAGASVARELAVRGVDTWLVERGDVSSGTTGRGEGNVVVADKEPGAELELALLGRAMYDELDARLGSAIGLRRRGSLVLYEDDLALESGARHVDRMLAAGVDARLVAPAELRELEPNLSHALAGATHFPRDVQVDAAALTRALVTEAQGAGARLSTGRRVRRIAVERGTVAGVETDAGEIACSAAVIAAGAWSASIAESAGLRLPVIPRKGQLAMTARTDGLVRHKLIDGSYAATVTAAGEGVLISSILEMTSDGHLLVGSSREFRGFDHEPDARVTLALLDRARAFLPVVGELPIERTWAGLRPYLPDHLPAIGPSSIVRGLWACTGHEGAGIGLGPISGRLLAQAYCAEPLALDLGAFAVDRFGALGDARALD